jgi:hypothetical protein
MGRYLIPKQALGAPISEIYIRYLDSYRYNLKTRARLRNWDSRMYRRNLPCEGIGVDIVPYQELNNRVLVWHLECTEEANIGTEYSGSYKEGPAAHRGELQTGRWLVPRLARWAILSRQGCGTPHEFPVQAKQPEFAVLWFSSPFDPAFPHPDEPLRPAGAQMVERGKPCC